MLLFSPGDSKRTKVKLFSCPKEEIPKGRKEVISNEIAGAAETARSRFHKIQIKSKGG